MENKKTLTETTALIRDLLIAIDSPHKEINLLDSRERVFVGDFMVGNLGKKGGKITFLIVTDKDVEISLSLSKETALSVAKVIANAAMDGESIQ